MAPVFSKFIPETEITHNPNDCFICLNQYNGTTNKRIQICENNHACC